MIFFSPPKPGRRKRVAASLTVAPRLFVLRFSGEDVEERYGIT
jgi:hypothetical protein